MTTITKIEQQFKEGKASGWKINLADGTWGYLDEKNSDKGLRDGDSVNYTTVTPEGKSYKKISARLVQNNAGSQPQSQSQPSHQSSAPTKVPLSGSEIKSHKVEASIKALGFVIDAYNADKIQWTEVATKQKECTNILFADIDEIYAEK